MTRERRLGRGLEALLGRPADAPAAGPQLHVVREPAPDGLAYLGVYDIDANPFQPRQDFEQSEIDALAESIQQHGVLQPIVVRRAGDRYQLIAGERRLRAAIQAGLNEVPAQVREADDRTVAELAIVENLQRKDLGPLEKAACFQDYLQRYGCKQEELAGRLKIDRSTISNLIRLLELPPAVQDALRSGGLTQGHARALLPLGDEREQVAFAKRIQSEGLSVRATEELVQETIRQADAAPPAVIGTTSRPSTAKRTRSQHAMSLEKDLRLALGTKVDIKQSSQGRGKIVLHFTSNDEFERLYQWLASTGK
ncbi:MAG: ParB/RepB/Spo0J family partition protein [Planctomycetes bacterium]|nr:ParB/RepB/Spo0J family partition protein [Planctomycetota bacterium]